MTSYSNELQKQINKETSSHFDDIIGNHHLIIENKRIAKKISHTEFPILIQGATGTGKNLFAIAIHHESNRRNSSFVTVDCHEQDVNLLEQSLFGKPDDTAPCLLEQANNGTLYLNNVGELPSRIQSRLVNLIDNKFWRKSEHSPTISSNVRIISSTTKPLELDERFRSDLHYRLNVLSIQLPEIKDMKEDIPLYVHQFLNKLNPTLRLDPAVEESLCEYDWPGNIREIKNVVHYMVTVSDGRSIQIHDLPQWMNEKLPVDQHKKKKNVNIAPIQLTMMDKLEYAFILNEIKQQNEKGEPASRRSISENSKSLPTPLTTQQVRHRLDFLEKHQYVTKGRGRAGTKITLEGLDFLLSLKDKIK
ncbi:sigma 54-interacting transcriptional regulator [Metabacillus malikii]|uniref:DNA-binding NtrC family response regulator n=1 Tax=Metabacillus malikii TaxID=1504265 RepID=A0ABT9Z9E8_9BACI|nr:sigma 54-interacting transcriptional regulator [Metabacillus malikii]MDQ0228872.1 DNA-binding NtrC family response regulator [Metabacillus malikii]